MTMVRVPDSGVLLRIGGCHLTIDAPHTWHYFCSSSPGPAVPIRNVPRLRTPIVSLGGFCDLPLRGSSLDRTKFNWDLCWTTYVSPVRRVGRDFSAGYVYQPDPYLPRMVTYASGRNCVSLGYTTCRAEMMIPSSLGGLRSANLCKPRPLEIRFLQALAISVLAQRFPLRYHLCCVFGSHISILAPHPSPAHLTYGTSICPNLSPLIYPTVQCAPFTRFVSIANELSRTLRPPQITMETSFHISSSDHAFHQGSLSVFSVGVSVTAVSPVNLRSSCPG